ncbi:rhodopsin, GQ-coupled-like [Haliotis rubra]|uniref:rhodopsin, GQ-coupled-like n=1 Tax=Haliotis rubra TaxID=36100 RepID=UPI001EE58E3B|nr:rhodopsin, GQ-coupled-like [Haliotis rubra]
MDQNIPIRAPPTAPTNRRNLTFQDVHVSGVITIILEVALLIENLLPLLVILWWKRPGERTVCDKLITALCVTFIFSALVPAPLGLVSYFYGSWYGGKGTCECYQVTSTWCTLSSMALVTYMCIDRHQTLCPCPSCKNSEDCRENVGIVVMLIYTVTLAIATLPVIGLGPEIMKGNTTCDSWIVLTPSSGRRQWYFISFLIFGFLNILLSTCSSIFIFVLLHKPDLADRMKKTRIPVEEGVSQLLRHQRPEENTSWMIVSLVLLVQLTWIPLLIMITFQKAGVDVSEAAMMYGLLATSLPGLLNPLLYGLLLDSYREGYKKIILKICVCCRPKAPETQELKGVASSRGLLTSERKRLTKVSIRDYTNSQSGPSGSHNPMFDTDSVTELVGQPDSEDGLTCDPDYDEYYEDITQANCAQCDVHDELYQSGGRLVTSEVMMTSTGSSDSFMDSEDLEHHIMDESVI